MMLGDGLIVYGIWSLSSFVFNIAVCDVQIPITMHLFLMHIMEYAFGLPQALLGLMLYLLSMDIIRFPWHSNYNKKSRFNEGFHCFLLVGTLWLHAVRNHLPNWLALFIIDLLYYFFGGLWYVFHTSAVKPNAVRHICQTHLSFMFLQESASLIFIEKFFP